MINCGGELVWCGVVIPNLFGATTHFVGPGGLVVLRMLGGTTATYSEHLNGIFRTANADPQLYFSTSLAVASGWHPECLATLHLALAITPLKK